MRITRSWAVAGLLASVFALAACEAPDGDGMDEGDMQGDGTQGGGMEGGDGMQGGGEQGGGGY